MLVGYQDGACMNLRNGEWTPDDKPLKIKIKILDKSSSKVCEILRIQIWLRGTHYCCF